MPDFLTIFPSRDVKNLQQIRYDGHINILVCLPCLWRASSHKNSVQHVQGANLLKTIAHNYIKKGGIAVESAYLARPFHTQASANPFPVALTCRLAEDISCMHPCTKRSDEIHSLSTRITNDHDLIIPRAMFLVIPPASNPASRSILLNVRYSNPHCCLRVRSTVVGHASQRLSKRVEICLFWGCFVVFDNNKTPLLSSSLLSSSSAHAHASLPAGLPWFSHLEHSRRPDMC